MECYVHAATSFWCYFCIAVRVQQGVSNKVALQCRFAVQYFQYLQNIPVQHMLPSSQVSITPLETSMTAITKEQNDASCQCLVASVPNNVCAE